MILVIKVMMKHQQAGLDHRREEEARGGFIELVRNHARERVAGIEEARADGRGLVADDQRDGHRFTERAAQRQDHATGNADARVGQHRVADDLPAGGAQGQQRFALRGGRRQDHLARDAGNQGQHHNHQDHSRSQQTESVKLSPGRTAGTPGTSAARAHPRLQPGSQDQKAKQSVDDAGNRSQQFHDERQGPLQRARAEIDQENGRANPDRNGENEGEGRGDQRPENGGCRPRRHCGRDQRPDS